MKFSSSHVGRLAGVAFTVVSILLRVHMCRIPVLSRRCYHTVVPVLSRRCYHTVIPVLGLLTSRLSGDKETIRSSPACPYITRGGKNSRVLTKEQTWRSSGQAEQYCLTEKSHEYLSQQRVHSLWHSVRGKKGQGDKKRKVGSEGETEGKNHSLN